MGRVVFVDRRSCFVVPCWAPRRGKNSCPHRHRFRRIDATCDVDKGAGRNPPDIFLCFTFRSQRHHPAIFTNQRQSPVSVSQKVQSVATKTPQQQAPWPVPRRSRFLEFSLKPTPQKYSLCQKDGRKPMKECQIRRFPATSYFKSACTTPLKNICMRYQTCTLACNWAKMTFPCI